MRSELNSIANELTDLAEKYEEASKTIHVWDEKDWDSGSNACNEADKEFDGRYFISGLTPVEGVKYLTSIISVLSKPKEEKQTLDYETMRQEFRNPTVRTEAVQRVQRDARFFNWDLARDGLEILQTRVRAEVEPATPPNEWDLDVEEEERDELELQDTQQPDQDEDQF